MEAHAIRAVLTCVVLAVGTSVAVWLVPHGPWSSWMSGFGLGMSTCVFVVLLTGARRTDPTR